MQAPVWGQQRSLPINLPGHGMGGPVARHVLRSYPRIDKTVDSTGGLSSGLKPAAARIGRLTSIVNS